MTDIYNDRKLSEGYPMLASLYLEAKVNCLTAKPPNMRVERLLTYLGRLVDIKKGCRMLIVGCGPKPVTLRKLVPLTPSP